MFIYKRCLSSKLANYKQNFSHTQMADRTFYNHVEYGVVFCFNLEISPHIVMSPVLVLPRNAGSVSQSLPQPNAPQIFQTVSRGSLLRAMF